MKRSFSAILSVVEDAKKAEGPAEWSRVLETIAEVAPAVQRTLYRTSYHAARGHVNSLLHARSKITKSDPVVAKPIWTAPAELEVPTLIHSAPRLPNRLAR